MSVGGRPQVGWQLARVLHELDPVGWRRRRLLLRAHHRGPLALLVALVSLVAELGRQLVAWRQAKVVAMVGGWRRRDQVMGGKEAVCIVKVGRPALLLAVIGRVGALSRLACVALVQHVAEAPVVGERAQDCVKPEQRQQGDEHAHVDVNVGRAGLFAPAEVSCNDRLLLLFVVEPY